MLPVYCSAQCEAAFMYLVTTAEPDDVIYLIHVTLIPEQGDDHSVEEITNLDTLLLMGDQLCTMYHQRAAAAGINCDSWSVFGQSVIEEIVEYSDLLDPDWIVIGAYTGANGQPIVDDIGHAVMGQPDKEVLIVRI